MQIKNKCKQFNDWERKIPILLFIENNDYVMFVMELKMKYISLIST